MRPDTSGVWGLLNEINKSGAWYAFNRWCGPNDIRTCIKDFPEEKDKYMIKKLVSIHRKVRKLDVELEEIKNHFGYGTNL